MISRVRGTLLRREIDSVEVMTSGGVAYELEIPSSVYERLPREGAEVELRSVQVVREDAVLLFGFLTDAERGIFTGLLAASGVGPRLALAVLSSLPPERVVRAIAERDVNLLRQIPGIGRKTAERMVLELADKLGDLGAAATGRAPEQEAASEAIGALVALGFSPGDAMAAVRKALDTEPSLSGAALIKAALATRTG